MSPSVPASALSSASAFNATGMLLSVSASFHCYHFFQRHATDQWLGLNLCKAVVQLLSNASTSTSPTVLPKLIGLNRFLRVDKRIQQRFDFYLALFVTKFLGVHLLLACSAVPWSVPRASHLSLCRFFSRAAVVLALSPEYRAVICVHPAIFIAHSYSFHLWFPIRQHVHLSLNLLIKQCAARFVGLKFSNRFSRPLANALAFTSLMSHQQSRPSLLQLSASVLTGASVCTWANVAPGFSACNYATI